ncbi:MAG: hypothetical protein ACOX9C_02070 [Kiritimatiellia bacterium]|jgi:hypothetical protein
MSAWDACPPDAKQVCAYLKQPGTHAGCKLFMIQGAQRKWAETWSDIDYLDFVACTKDYVVSPEIEYHLRSVVVDDFIRSATRRIKGGATETMKVKIREMVADVMLNLPSEIQDNADAAHAMTRDSLLAYQFVKKNGGNNTEAMIAVRKQMAQLLLYSDTAPQIAQTILRTQDDLRLSDSLTSSEIESLVKNPKCNDAEIQKMLNRLKEGKED